MRDQMKGKKACHIKMFLIIPLIYILTNGVLFAQIKTQKKISTFDHRAHNYIDTIYCKEKYETTIILPTKKKIKTVVTGDPDNWEIAGEVGGRIISVKPLRNARETSLTIISQAMNIYKFNIINTRTIPKKVEVVALVQIREKHTSMEVIGHQESARKTPQKIAANPKILIQTNRGYTWKDKYFHIEDIYDDGIFTYIIMPKSQEYPALFIIKGKKRKNLEPIKYVIEPGKIIIHRIISKKESILLRLGSDKSKRETLIIRKRK